MVDRHVLYDRRSAGALLGIELARAEIDTPVVLGLPRGGLPVAAQVAEALDAPLDVIVVRKLGVPGRRELAMGAIGENGAIVLNDDVVLGADVTDDELRHVESRERAELDTRGCVESVRCDLASRWMAARRSSSTTESPQEQPCVPRSGCPGEWCPRCDRGRPRCPARCRADVEVGGRHGSCAWPNRIRSGPSATGIAISTQSATTRSSP